MKFSDKLRSDAAITRQTVAELLKAIEVTPSRLRERLAAAQSHTTIEAMKTDINGIAASIPSGASEKRVIAVITGSVTANVLESLADLADYFVASGALKRVSERIRQHSDLQKAINLAAAAGDWDGFNRIVDELAGQLVGGTGNDQGKPVEVPDQNAAGAGGGGSSAEQPAG